MRLTGLILLLLATGCASDGRIKLDAVWSANVRQIAPDRQAPQEYFQPDPLTTNPTLPRV